MPPGSVHTPQPYVQTSVPLACCPHLIVFASNKHTKHTNLNTFYYRTDGRHRVRGGTPQPHLTTHPHIIAHSGFSPPVTALDHASWCQAVYSRGALLRCMISFPLSTKPCSHCGALTLPDPRSCHCREAIYCDKRCPRRAWHSVAYPHREVRMGGNTSQLSWCRRCTRASDQFTEVAAAVLAYCAKLPCHACLLIVHPHQCDVYACGAHTPGREHSLSPPLCHHVHGAAQTASFLPAVSPSYLTSIL